MSRKRPITWRQEIKKRFEELGLWVRFIQFREEYRRRGYTIDGCWAAAERELFKIEPGLLAGMEPFAPPEAFEGVEEEECEAVSGAVGGNGETVDRSLQEEVPLPELPVEKKIPPLETLSWVISELGILDPDEMDRRRIRLARRQALVRAPSYHARWMFIQACTESKMREKVFDAWRATLPSRQQIESSEKLRDDGRSEIEFADRALKSLEAKKKDEQS